MAVIGVSKFGGMFPSANPQLLAEEQAVYAKNLDLRFGDFRPLQVAQAVSTLGGAYVSVYNHFGTIIGSTVDTNYVRGPVQDDSVQRTYYTKNSGTPSAYVVDGSMAVRQLGVPAPTTKPTCSVVPVESYTPEAEAAARAKAPTQIFDAITANLAFSPKGMSSTDLTSFGLVDNSDPSNKLWKDFVVPGSTASGTFVPTDPDHKNLQKLWFVKVVDGQLRVPFFVRGSGWTINKAAAATALAAIPTPDPTSTGFMMSSAAASNIADAVEKYLASRDAEVAAITDQIKAMTKSIFDVANNQNVSGYVPKAIVQAYYALSGTATRISTAVTAAAKQLVDVSDAYTNTVSVTEGEITTALNSYIYEADDGSKKLNVSQFRTWTKSKFRAYTVDDPSAQSSMNFDIDAAIQALVSELEVIRTDWASYPEGAGDEFNQAVVDMLTKMFDDLYKLSVKVDDIGTSIKNGVKDEAKKWFDAEVAGGFPQGTEPVLTSRAYVVTYVTDWGEESAPSPVSDIIDVDENDTIAVQFLDTPPAGRHIAYRRLYRSATGSTTSAFMFQNEYPVATTSIEDSTPADQLGEACATFGWAPPPDDLRGLTALPNGILIGHVGQLLYVCEPYAPYAWPVKYTIPLGYDIIGISTMGQGALVTTTGPLYIVSGTDGATMTADKVASTQQCVSKRSMVELRGTVIYASADGLVAYANGTHEVFTEGLISKAAWAEFNPSSITAADYEGRYYAFYNKTDGTKGCLIFDYQAKVLVDSDMQAAAVYSDTVADKLYGVSGTTLYNLMPASTSYRSAVWRSKVFSQSRPTSFAWLYVEAANMKLSYVNNVDGVAQPRLYFADVPGVPPSSGVPAQQFTVTVRITTEYGLQVTMYVASPYPIRLPVGRHTNWQIEVEATVPLTRVLIASSTEEMKAMAGGLA